MHQKQLSVTTSQSPLHLCSLACVGSLIPLLLSVQEVGQQQRDVVGVELRTSSAVLVHALLKHMRVFILVPFLCKSAQSAQSCKRNDVRNHKCDACTYETI
eukprot:1160650-Pelagomonas_calceolata.AAC.13